MGKNKYFLLCGFLIILIIVTIATYFLLFRQTSMVSISDQIVHENNPNNAVVNDDNQKKISRLQPPKNVEDVEIEIAQVSGQNTALSVASDKYGKIFLVRGIWKPIQQEVDNEMFILQANPENVDSMEILPIKLPLQEVVTNFSDPQIAVDGLGNVHIAWSSPSITTPQDSRFWDRIWYMKVDNNGTVLIAPTMIINRTNFGTGGGYGSDFNVGTQNPQIAVDSDNNAYIVWGMWKPNANGWETEQPLLYIHIAKVDPQGKQIDIETNTFIEGKYPNIFIQDEIAHLVWLKDLGPEPQSQDPNFFDDTPFHIFDINYAQFPITNIPSIPNTMTLVANTKDISFPSITSIGDFVYVVAGKYYFELNQDGSVQKQNVLTENIAESPTGIVSESDLIFVAGDNGFIDANHILHAGIIKKSIVNPESYAIFYKRMMPNNTSSGTTQIDDEIPPDIDPDAHTLYTGYVKIVPISLSEIKKKLEKIGCLTDNDQNECSYLETVEPYEKQEAIEVYPQGRDWMGPMYFYITEKKLWALKDIPGPPDPEKFKNEVRQDVLDIKNIIDIQENSWQITETIYPWMVLY